MNSELTDPDSSLVPNDDSPWQQAVKLEFHANATLAFRRIPIIGAKMDNMSPPSWTGVDVQDERLAHVPPEITEGGEGFITCPTVGHQGAINALASPKGELSRRQSLNTVRERPAG